jgi:uncharacterized membrane protein
MPKTRLEAFSDGVLAIIITIMVLELKVPHGEDLSALQPLLPVFFTYVLSFVYIGIYWNNHHHMLHAVKRVTGGVLWANLHLLFWLSLFPFVTGWMGENHFAQLPTALYGGVLLMAAIAYWILTVTIINEEGRDSLLARAVGRDLKGKLSPVAYAAAIALSFVNHWIAAAIYILVALVWLVPDRRIERVLTPPA